MSISWKDVLHYGAALGLLALGVVGQLGVPGIDAKTCFIAGAGILGAGLKGGFTSGGKAAVALLAVCCLVASAHAQVPLPTKAPHLAIGPYPTNGCGAYYGVNAMTSAAPITGASVGATAIGGDIGGTLGYTCAAGSTFWFVEAMADFQNLNGSANGLALTGPAHLEQRVGFGSPLNNLLSSLPGISLPATPAIPGLPTGVTAGTPAGYIYAAINEDDISATLGLSSAREWLVSPEFGVGLKTHLSDNAEIDTWAGVKLESDALCLGPNNCPTLSAGPVAGVAVEY